MATASADGHVRVWDVSSAESPKFVADLGAHSGAVLQVAWAPAEIGVLLASVGRDGRAVIWGRRANESRWQVLHQEDFGNGAVNAAAWAPAEHGAVLAIACTDGTVGIIVHSGPLDAGDGTVEHRWLPMPLTSRSGPVNGISWASPPEVGEVAQLGLYGARFATAGENGVCIWSWDEHRQLWLHEELCRDRPTRDVAWKQWDGDVEMLACAEGDSVAFWSYEGRGGLPAWQEARPVDLGHPVWRVEWSGVGGALLASCGGDKQQAILLKQRLCGAWDLMDPTALEN